MSAADAPLTGSSDEHHARSRVALEVDRGHRLGSEWEARMAVDIARERLGPMRGRRRMVWIGALVEATLGAAQLAVGEEVLGALFLALAVVLGVGGTLVLERVARPPWEQALRLNSETGE
jgi:hypothetical protein